MESHVRFEGVSNKLERVYADGVGALGGRPEITHYLVQLRPGEDESPLKPATKNFIKTRSGTDSRMCDKFEGPSWLVKNILPIPIQVVLPPHDRETPVLIETNCPPLSAMRSPLWCKTATPHNSNPDPMEPFVEILSNATWTAQYPWQSMVNLKCHDKGKLCCSISVPYKTLNERTGQWITTFTKSEGKRLKNMIEQKLGFAPKVHKTKNSYKMFILDFFQFEANLKSVFGRPGDLTLVPTQCRSLKVGKMLVKLAGSSFVGQEGTQCIATTIILCEDIASQQVVVDEYLRMLGHDDALKPFQSGATYIPSSKVIHIFDKENFIDCVKKRADQNYRWTEEYLEIPPLAVAFVSKINFQNFLVTGRCL